MATRTYIRDGVLIMLGKRQEPKLASCTYFRVNVENSLELIDIMVIISSHIKSEMNLNESLIYNGYRTRNIRNQQGDTVIQWIS